MPAFLRCIFVTEVFSQAITQAALGSEQIQHRVNPCNLGVFVSAEAGVQFLAQRGAVEIALQQAVDLGHLLAFQLDPALFLKVIQCFDHSISLGLMLLIQRVEIHRGPGSGTAGGLDNGCDKIPALALETRQQGVGFQQVLESVLRVIGIARGNDSTQLQLHQQGFERELTDVALVRQRSQQKLPLSFRGASLQFV
ncbi:hypothetical protein D3C84_762150 [compost metagenome]